MTPYPQWVLTEGTRQIIADAWASADVFGTNTILEVDMYTDGGSRQTTDFTVVIF